MSQEKRGCRVEPSLRHERLKAICAGHLADCLRTMLGNEAGMEAGSVYQIAVHREARLH
jgi:hypothetical protein